jgi:hypothetical protein
MARRRARLEIRLRAARKERRHSRRPHRSRRRHRRRRLRNALAVPSLSFAHRAPSRHAIQGFLVPTTRRQSASVAPTMVIPIYLSITFIYLFVWVGLIMLFHIVVG